MNGPSALIAEDEPLLRAEIRTVLESLWPELRVVAEVGDGISAIDALDRLSPDIMFLDIQMPGCTGIDVAQRASNRAHVVFITAYDSHALTAFEQGALDYILKPISPERVKVAIKRLQDRFEQPPANLDGLVDLLKGVATGGKQYLKWLTVPHGSNLRVVSTAEILFLRADNKYTELATVSAMFLLNSSLKEMLGKLDPAVFWQIHRGVAVNVSAIETIYRTFRGTLEVKVRGRDELLPVSGAHAHLFKQS